MLKRHLRSSSGHTQVLCRLGVLKEFVIFTGKHIQWNPIFIKAACCIEVKIVNITCGYYHKANIANKHYIKRKPKLTLICSVISLLKKDSINKNKLT